MSSEQQRPASGAELASLRNSIMDGVLRRVNDLTTKGALHLPPGYSAPNALRSAWLIIQALEDRDRKPILPQVEADSVAQSMLYMVVQGLNPDKKQCYFIKYGARLTCQRSYFGDMALAKRADERVGDIFPVTVYEGDELVYRIKHGRFIIEEHKQKLENRDKRVISAYCEVLDRQGNVIQTVLMTAGEIQQSWSKSKTAFGKDGGLAGTHAEFTADMCMRTVVRKACKPIINSSSDDYLVRQFTASDSEESIRTEIDSHANQGPVIDLDMAAPAALPAAPEPEVFAPPAAREPEPVPAARTSAAAAGGQPLTFDAPARPAQRGPDF